MIENSPEEIVELVEEMLERLENRAVATPEDDALQALARRTIDSPVSTGTNARIGREHLRRYGRKVFDENGPAIT